MGFRLRVFAFISNKNKSTSGFTLCCMREMVQSGCFWSLGRTRIEWRGIRRLPLCEIIDRGIFVECGSGLHTSCCVFIPSKVLNVYTLVEAKIRQERQRLRRQPCYQIEIIAKEKFPYFICFHSESK